MPEEIARVYEQHVTSVWRYVRARVPNDADAEDVTSEVFVRATRSWARYDERKGSEGAWLSGIAHHVVADWWRRRPHGDVPLVAAGPGSDLAAPDVDGPERAAEVAETVDEVRRRLEVLTEREREAVALRFGAGLTSGEVGAVLGISDAGARMLVHRAVAKLRKELRHG